jgi:hypothetical protein
MKELLRSNIGKKAVKAMIWGLVGIAIAAAGNGLLILAIEFLDIENMGSAFGFIYGLVYCLAMASYFVFMAALITLIIMIIAKYGKRRFCNRVN